MLQKLLTGPNLIVVALMAWCAVMMRNAALRRRQSPRRDVDKELSNEPRIRQRSAEGRMPQLEIRLHNYDRDVAARVKSTLNLLDQLISEGDQEIVRLESLIENRKLAKTSSLPAEQCRMVAHLAGAGYSIGEIARLTGRSEEIIAQVVNDEPDRNQRAA
jgi:DNA-directed RNA polymerase specialized sigma24 family protein